MGPGSGVDKRRQQWCSEFEIVKKDMGLFLGQDGTPLSVGKSISWQSLCQSSLAVANQDDCLQPLTAVSSR